MAQLNLSNLARKGVLWLLSVSFVLLLSSAIIGFAFMQKFFDAPTYNKSMEKRGVYEKLRDYFSGMFLSAFPDELKGEANGIISQAVTVDYIRNQMQKMVQSGLDYLSSNQEDFSLSLDISNIKSMAQSSQNPAMQSVAPFLPSEMDFGKAIKGSPQFSQLQQLRSQIADTNRLNGFAVVASILILIPYFLLQPDYRTGLHECSKLIFSCGISTLIGGIAMAYLSPQFLPQFLSGISQGGAAAETAKMVGAIMGDVLYEVGVAAAIYSLPFVALGMAGRIAFLPPGSSLFPAFDSIFPSKPKQPPAASAAQPQQPLEAASQQQDAAAQQSPAQNNGAAPTPQQSA